MAQRPQSLTAELEKIEQKITLTLQEIDHNFARAHRIVTSSILPIVERYGQESEAVWEGSKFWKQFFEASANVAISNYQEDVTYDDEEETDVQQEETTYAEDATSMAASSPGHYSGTHRVHAHGDYTRDEDATQQTMGGEEGPEEDEGETELDLDDSMLDSLNLTSAQLPMQSTPKSGRSTGSQGWADIESPFETLAKELTMKYGSPERAPRQQLNRFRQPTSAAALEADSSTLPPPPTTPRTTRRYAGSPDSSPFRPPARTPGVDQDAIMHRVLDKNWRLQATPLKPAPSRYRPAAAATPKPKFGREFDSSPISSPPAPQLRTQIFTPRALRTPGAARFEAAAALAGQQSVKGMGKASAIGKYDYMYDDDSDDDILLPAGLSPPKTMRFDLPPSKLIATPAKAASRRIVRDILQTAGEGDDTMTTDASSPPRGGRGRMMDDDDDPF
ncbi:DASH complex subunit Ask1-domain-containing protein [Tricharina praecox]|uniref:DASH complex subunit Ask1-domain-containing protein n=1 Tax=Tricharina praecox TaxID=43433 RepID=UPI002220F3D0|nr:DASH complex subunit Ask1-domain-containing protein [Tricharina praecox]KAI5842868.1 DASH complex subunit Ask1-domain-containing protein [Tricharina praecox]